MKGFSASACGYEQSVDFIPKRAGFAVKSTAATLKRARSESRCTPPKHEKRTNHSAVRSKSKKKQFRPEKALTSYHSDSCLPECSRAKEDALASGFSNLREAYSLVRALNILADHGKKQWPKAA